MGRALHWLASATFGIAVWGLPLTAQGTEIVRGLVRDTTRHPVAGAQVTITGRQTGLVRTVRTRDDGSFTAVFESDQQFHVVVRQVGYLPATSDAERSGLSPVIVMPDMILSYSPYLLNDIVTTAYHSRPVPIRGHARSVGGAASDRAHDAVFLLDPSDLAALAATTPGVVATGDSGFSVLGADPTQNAVQVDGLTFGGGHLPRDAIGKETLVVSTYDPANGQFAGGLLAVTTKEGSQHFGGIIRPQLADPHLAWADPRAGGGVVPRLFTLSGYLTGPLHTHNGEWRVSADVTRSDAIDASLSNSRPSALRALGISFDTLAVVDSALGALGAPRVALDGPRNSTFTVGSAAGRFDFRPGSLTSLTLTTLLDWSRDGGNGITALSFPSTASADGTSNAMIGLHASAYVNGWLAQVHASADHSTAFTRPYIDAPQGIVRVGTTPSDAPPSLADLRFGGSSAGATSDATDQAEIRTELSWVPRNNRHLLSAVQDITWRRESTTNSQDRTATYEYLSLVDLIANMPAEFIGASGGDSLRLAGTSSFYSFSDTWRAMPGVLDVQGGVRVDVARAGDLPAYNPGVDQQFGLRTDRIPSVSAVSPRVGFSWTPSRTRGSDEVQIESVRDATGQSALVATRSGGSLNQLQAPQPGGGAFNITGGVGAFRGTVPTGRIWTVTRATGLPGSTVITECVGAAVPPPDWSRLTTAPSDGCAVSDAAQPSVTVFGRRYQPPVSWRANVQVNGLVIGGWALAPAALLSINQHMESRLDVNLDTTRRFTLATEGNRPVYGSPSDVTAEGLIDPEASRTDRRFGVVDELVSDGRSAVGQFAVTVAPIRPLRGHVGFAASYILTASQVHQRGFTGSTAGDPFAEEASTGSEPTHQFRLNFSNITIPWVRLDARVDVTSGYAYTPLVNQDINNDGRTNDRAFVPPMSAAVDPGLAAGLSRLLANAPAGARHCLLANMGRIAAANSCRAPWRFQLDLALSVGGAPGPASSRIRFTAVVQNALTGLLAITGQTQSGLARSLTGPLVDSRLLFVTGFDPSRQAYQYAVNPNFGSPVAGARYLAPFRVQLGAEIELGSSHNTTLLHAFGLDRSRTRVDSGVVAHALQRVIRDPFVGAPPQHDSSSLSANATLAFHALHLQFIARRDSLLAPVVRAIAAAGRGLTDQVLRDILDEVRIPLTDLENEMAGRMALLTASPSP